MSLIRVTLHIVHMLHFIVSQPLNHSQRFMSVLVNLRSRLLVSIAEIGMCHYSHYNSDNIYDSGRPIWRCILSAGPLRMGCMEIVTLPWDICYSPLGVNAIKPAAENCLSPEMLIYHILLQLLIVFYFLTI